MSLPEEKVARRRSIAFSIGARRCKISCVLATLTSSSAKSIPASSSEISSSSCSLIGRMRQKGAQCEFARLSQAGPGVNRALDAQPEHDGRAVAGDLHYVFGGVGSGSRKERNDYLVHRGAGFIGQLGQFGAPGMPARRMRKTQDVSRYGAALCAGEADHA